MRPPDSKPIGFFLLILGFSGLACFPLGPPFGLLGLGVGSLCLVTALGILGRSGQFARALGPFVGKSVRVEIWGRPLPGLEGVIQRVDSIAPLGLGVWIYLHPVSGGTSLKLKIAQPVSLTLGPGKAELTFAGYAQWDSRRVKDANGRRAPGTVVLFLA